MSGERGTVSAVLLATLMFLALMGIASIDAASVLLASARARNAAESAALSAAVEQWPFLGSGADPHAAAVRMAGAHDADLEACVCPPRGDRAVVTVAVRPRV